MQGAFDQEPRVAARNSGPRFGCVLVTGSTNVASVIASPVVAVDPTTDSYRQGPGQRRASQRGS